jgi:alpha-mannosidase
VLETPHAHIRFNRQGSILSWYLKGEDRELCLAGSPMNSLLIGEDVPDMWDNWDIDVDQERMLRPGARLESRQVVSDGPLEMRVRSVYTLGRASRLTQDIVVRADSPAIRFDTRIDWRERHQLLKVAFPIDIHAQTAKHEIQFGHLDRPTHRNLPQDRARFEVCCHKWSDLSDGGFGVALLNDCKYGVSVFGSEVRLTLVKSGTHPDPCADNGDHHRFSYTLLPHRGGFSVESVVRPAYELNTPLVIASGTPKEMALESLLKVSAPNIIVETIKRSEDGEDLIVRLYEAGRTACHCLVEAPWAQEIWETNLLEESVSEVRKTSSLKLWFRPFEIKTLRLRAR